MTRRSPLRQPRRAPLLTALAALALAACGQSQSERQIAQDLDTATISQFAAGHTLSEPITAASASAAPSFAVLALPATASQGKLTEKQYVNGWRQSVALAGGRAGGDYNDLSIEIMGEAPPDSPIARPNVLRITKPTAEGVRREVLARFHGVPMRIVGRPLSNVLGPFGLAIGAGPGGMRCAFAWQWVGNLAALAQGEKSNFFNNGEMAASIRMRLCRSGVTADQLAGWYEQLQIADPAQVARIAEAIRRNTQSAEIVGGPGTRISAASDSLESTLIGERAPRAESAPARRRHAARRAAPAAQETPYTPPTGPAAPLTTPQSPGAQYLAPTGGPIASGGAGFGVVRGVDPSLPARAYRGPSSARAVAPPPGGAPVYLGPTPQ